MRPLRTILKHPSVRFAILPLFSVGMGLLSRLVILGVSGVRVPYMAFLPWMVLSTLAGGLLSASLTLGIFVFISFISPEPTTLIRTNSSTTGLILFTGIGLILILVTHWTNGLRARMRAAALAIRESDQRLRVALDAGGMGTWEWTIATGAVVWSPGLERIHGRTPGSFRGTFEDVMSDIHADDREHFVSTVKLALAKRSDYRVEYRIHTASGEERWVEARGRVVCDAQGEPQRMMGVCLDASDRKRGEQALFQRDKQMRLITDALPALISYVDRQERYLFVSRAYETWLCRSSDDIVGRTIREIAPAHGYEKIQPHLQAVLAGKIVSYSTTMTYPDGVTREVDVTYSPDLAADGTVNGFAVLVTDVSEHRRTEQALLASEQLYRALAEAVPEFVWSCAADGRVEYLNPRYVEYTGLTIDDVNEGWHDIVYPDDHGRVGLAWMTSLRTGEPFELEYRIRNRHSGEFRWFLNRTVPVRGERGEVLRWVGAATDIHDSKIARQERERLLDAERLAREEAERAGRAKDQFLAVLSHELRTPLTPVLMTVSLIEANAELPPSLRQDMASIRRSVELEARLIDDLLDLTRLARGKIRYDFQTVDLQLLVRSALSICCNDGKLEVSVDLSAEDSYVRGDPARLQQVFWNLLNNAWKFTPAGGKITVSTSSAEGRISVRVTDSGAGIEADLLPRVFDAFEQGDAIRARKFGGLGLGLAICKALVEAHGGTITAQSDGVGCGASFIVDLPSVPAPSAPDKPAGMLPSIIGPNGCRLRMLLVEDHPYTLQVMIKLLSAIGHEVDGASSVADCLRIAEMGRRYDLVISDLGLPDGTGFDLMRQLKQKYGLPGIALSGYGMEEDIERSREAGFTEHLVKPVDMQTLRDAVARVAQLSMAAKQS